MFINGRVMFAVIETGSKQYHVKVGDVIRVEKLDVNVGDTFEFNRVLATDAQIGSPLLENAKVTAEVLDQRRDKKVIVFKKKRRHNYRRKNGHRQSISVLKITNIVF